MKIEEFLETVMADPELRRKYFHGNENAFTKAKLLTLERLTFHILTRGAQTLNDCLIKEFGNGKKRPDKSTLVKAMAKIDINFWVDLYSYISQESMKRVKLKTFRGYRLYAIDSTTLALASYDPECFQSKMVTHGQVSSYYALHINSVYDVCNDMFIDNVIQKGKELDERKAAIAMIHQLRNENEKQIFLFDRGYPGYNLIAHLIENGQFFLIRSTNTASIGGTLWEKYGGEKKEGSIDVTINLTRVSQTTLNRLNGYDDYISLPANTKFDYLPEKSPLKRGRGNSDEDIEKALKECSHSLSFRVVRVKIGEEGSKDEYETLITNLCGEDFSLKDLKELYFRRWSQEVSFRELKHHEHLLYLHAKKTDSVIAEIYAALILHNMTAAMSLKAVEIGEKEKEILKKRVNHDKFKDVLRKCRKYMIVLPEGDFGINHSKAVFAVVNFLHSDEEKNETVEDLLKELVKNPVPVKPGRSFARRLRPRGFIGFIYRAP